MEFESELEDALGEAARCDQLPIRSGQDVRPCENRGAVGRIERIARVRPHGNRLIYARHVDDVEEVGASPMTSMRIDSRIGMKRE